MSKRYTFKTIAALLLASTLPLSGCLDEVEGIAPGNGADTTVVFDFFYRPLPKIPLPNDLATRYDSASGKMRINASQVAPTVFEKTTRQLVDTLSGWGTYSPISVPFSGPLDIKSIVDRHHGDDYDFKDDVMYVIDVTEGSPTYGQPAVLDIGNGNFPVVLEKIDHYWPSDIRRDTNSILFEEHDEDLNGNGKLDPGEDTDLDGHLDKPNWFPFAHGRFDPAKHKDFRKMDLAQRADALMTFYERETNTLIARPLIPLRAKTTYAVIVTERLLDADGEKVGSPFDFIHHLGQKDALAKLPDILAAGKDTFGGLAIKDVAFAWTFTTADVYADLTAVRDGLYGHGAQKHLADEFPADLSDINKLWDKKPKYGFENLHIVSGESFKPIVDQARDGLLGKQGPVQKERDQIGLQYVGHHIFGTYKSPRMFRRTDAEGNYLNYNQMSWPADMDSKKAMADAEEVTFWMTVPRKEATKDGKPLGVVILGHGYTSNKAELMGFHSHFSRMGLAVVAIDNVSHGLDLKADDKILLDLLLASRGMKKLGDALTRNRSWDQNVDEVGDSGADFWTAYTFHTRDVVRQTAVDYVQLIRILRSWDGTKRWSFDVNGSKAGGDLAGDFDGDGKVDLGGPNMPVTMTGGSLGGIMAAVMGGLEPHLEAVLPVAGGGGLIDVGVRSIQGGVKEAVTLRLMGPLYVGQPDAKSGDIRVRTVVPNLNKTAMVHVATIPKAVADKLAVGDSLLARNLSNGEYDCARLIPEQGCVNACKKDDACKKRCVTFRVAIASDISRDKPQKHELAFYKGDAFQMGVIDPKMHRACKLKADAGDPVHVVNKFGVDVKFHFQSAALDFKKDTHLSPIAEGLGLHRARPAMRRFLGFAQMVLDPADPAVWAVNFKGGQLTYGNGDEVKTHAIVLNTVGDMNVPVNTGAAIGRAAGLIDFKTPVKEWGGRTVNQVLLDTFVIESVDKIPRYVQPNGAGILFDPEDLSQSATPTSAGGSPLPAVGQIVRWDKPAARGNDGFHAPRLQPPLHKHAVGKDTQGGISGTFFPYIEPGGKHGFWEPGQHTDRLIAWCKQGAQKKIDAAKSCEQQPWFDHGAMVVESMAVYLRSGGKEFRLDPCMSTGTCKGIPAPPAARK